MPFTDFGVKDNVLYRITRGRFAITSVSKYNDINDSWDYAVPDTEEFVRSLRMLSYPEYKEIMYRYKIIQELKK
jgi:hypothetical protein